MTTNTSAGVGSTSITTLGTISTGVWNGTAIDVSHGGTGNNTFTAYSLICAGTTATGIFQNVSGVGTSGQVLTSAGASALPTWSNISYTVVDQTTTSVTMAVNTTYIADNAALVTFTLPTTAAQGSYFRIVGKGAGGWKVAQNASQQINFGNVATTTGAGGSLASTNQYDCVEFLCVTANNNYTVMNSIGNITYV